MQISQLSKYETIVAVNATVMTVYDTQELQLLGYPPLVAVGGDKLDAICLINVVYDLMSQLKQFQSSDKETQDQSHKVLTDLQHCQVRVIQSRHFKFFQKNEIEILLKNSGNWPARKS
jgi:hypothetical protein